MSRNLISIKTNFFFFSSSSDPVASKLSRMAQVYENVCRLCAFKYIIPGLLIFSPEGIQHGLQQKIHECLQFTASNLKIITKFNY